METMLYAASSEPDRGWGGPIALLVAVGLFLLFIGIQEYRNPSPTEDDESGVKVNSQVSAVSDTDDTEPDTGSWWGRIVDRNGRRVRVAELPVDDDLDLELDGDDERETVEQAVARLVGQRRPYMEIVRHLMAEHRVSAATAKRRIREHREAA